MLGRRRHHAALGLACVAVLLSAASASAEEQLPAQPVTEVCAGPSGEGGGQRVCGTLNPHVNERVGYHFAYNAGAECTGGAMTPAGQEVEGEGIAVSAQLAGLAPETTYSYCLVATNEFGESVGEALSFETPAAGHGPEQPITEACAGLVGGGGQRVCGTLNPHVNERVGYHFAYNAGAECTGGAMTPAGQEVEGEGIAVSAQLAGLAPETTYSYCLVATNEFGESVGEALSFRTPGPSSTTADYTPGGPGPRSDVAFGSASLVGPLVLGAPGPAKRLARAMRACRRMPVRQRARCRRHARARYQRAHGRSERAAAPS